jgi:hypothetical protein
MGKKVKITEALNSEKYIITEFEIRFIRIFVIAQLILLS